MSELTPVTRIEEYLDAIVDGGTPPLEDVTRVETFLDCILNNQTCALTPVTRIETYLAKISGASVTLPVEPVTRVEQYLAKIAGEDVEIPDEPVTRIEEWLAEWANGGSPEYATVTGAIASFVTLRAAPLKELVVDIDQAGGCTGCEIQRTGKNLIDPNTKEETSATVARWEHNGFTLKAGQAYTLSSNNPEVTVYITEVGGATTVKSGSPSVTYTPTEDKDVYFRAYLIPSIEGVELQLELGSTASDYEAYQGNTYSIDWTADPGSITNGTLTVAESGDVTLTTGGTDYDLGELSISTLLGQNYLWADCTGSGNVKVTYYYPGTTASPIVGVGTVNNMVI